MPMNFDVELLGGAFLGVAGEPALIFLEPSSTRMEGCNLNAETRGGSSEVHHLAQMEVIEEWRVTAVAKTP